MVDVDEKKLEHTFDLVKMTLKEHPETRNSDNVLIIKFLEDHHEIFDWAKFREKMKNHEFTLESVRRARQKIQSGGEYLPTIESVIQRRKLQDVYIRVMAR